MAICAEGFAAHGHEVVVVTSTNSAEPDKASYRVIRGPGPIETLTLARWCEVYFQANVSLRGLWPLALVRRPWIAAHHTWYRRADGRIGVRDVIKRWLLRYAEASIAVSNAIAADLDTPSIVIENPYQDKLFRRTPGVARTGTLIFVGRLVSDKGLDVLLDALGQLKARGCKPNLSILGDGPERPALETRVRKHGLEAQVQFLGVARGDELVAELNRHRILIVPSRYSEPFGVVALEAIACGCAVVGSSGGGLPEAIGGCGRTFPNGDVAALARTLEEVLSDVDSPERMLAGADSHLAEHASDLVVQRYLAILATATKRFRMKR